MVVQKSAVQLRNHLACWIFCGTVDGYLDISHFCKLLDFWTGPVIEPRLLLGRSRSNSFLDLYRISPCPRPKNRTNIIVRRKSKDSKFLLCRGLPQATPFPCWLKHFLSNSSSSTFQRLEHCYNKAGFPDLSGIERTSCQSRTARGGNDDHNRREFSISYILEISYFVHSTDHSNSCLYVVSASGRSSEVDGMSGRQGLVSEPSKSRAFRVALFRS
jgi:hypothetical protein